MFILVRPINCSLPTIQKRLFESLRTALINEKNYDLALFVEKRYCNCLWGYLLPHDYLNTLGKWCD